jgi:phenol hydroxylase P4 protein
MTVASVGEYTFPSADAEENFHGARLLYVGWDQHTLFCAPFAWPFPPNMRFGDLIEGVFPGAFGYHPEFAQIDWSAVQWLKSGEPWQPDVDKTLEENGLRHKDVLRFRTPGLTGLRGSGA